MRVVVVYILWSINPVAKKKKESSIYVVVVVVGIVYISEDVVETDEKKCLVLV